MLFQMQFVGLLRLLEANITVPFMNFLDSLKWMNLHFEVDISFFNCDNEVRMKPCAATMAVRGEACLPLPWAFIY